MAAFRLADRPETIEETAAQVTALGGTGIAIRADHTDERQVSALFRRVKKKHGHLDLIVNDIWGGEELIEWGKPLWELTMSNARLLIERAVLSHITTSRYGIPLMLGRGKGLVIEVTDAVDFGYRSQFMYDHVKNAVLRLAFGLSEELRPHGIAAIALSPGFLRSEAMLDHFGVSEANWRDAGKADPHFLQSESPRYVGRAVAALASDTKVMALTGRAFTSGQLARAYGFTDEDGAQPRAFAEYIAGCTDAVARKHFEEMHASHGRFLQMFGDLPRGRGTRTLPRRR